MSNLHNGEFSFSNENFQRDFELLLKALDASISGIIITDNQQPDNPIIYCNVAFEKMTGYTRQEIIGRNCRFLQKEDRQQVQRGMLRDAIQNEAPCVIEIRNYRKDGTLFWNELYMSPVKKNGDKALFFIGVQNDITRRKKAEMDIQNHQAEMENKIATRTQSLKDSQDYLMSILQTVREGLIVLNNDLTVLSVNEHFLRTFKVTSSDTVGKKLYDLGNGQWNIPKLKELLEKVLPSNNPVVDFEVSHDFPHIGKKLMLLNAYQVELEGEYKDRILLAIEDITDRRAIEKRKDDFLSIASHELKTPLTTIKGYIQMMHRFMPENANERFRTTVKKTEIYVERLNRLISELLDVSKIQSGNIELHVDNFDFDKMVREAIEALQTATKTHRIVIEGKSVDHYRGDESHLVQVINNLVGNAIKYSPEGNQVTVYLSLVSNYLKVSVTDKGIGISQDDQHKIFDRFYRVDEVQTRFPGMGIGLYVCDQIIQNHGGTLWVESELGKGSTFSFTLPLKERSNNG
ncbi:MAG TPA: ATP-binding protein [Mucilaginibacter sp.]|nr:ATP-binding protein [Mucilaginibacter sp.]